MADVVPIVPTPTVEGCNWCRGEIVWAVTSSGKRMPLDWPATINGNVYFTWDPEAKTWRATVQTRWEARSPSWAEVPRHVHHAMTCPAAGEWNEAARQARGAKPDERQRPSGLSPAVHPAGNARPVQEGMF